MGKSTFSLESGKRLQKLELYYLIRTFFKYFYVSYSPLNVRFVPVPMSVPQPPIVDAYAIAK